MLEIIFMNQQNYKNFTYTVLKEYLLDVQIVFYFPKNFYLVESMNEKMGVLKAAGLVNLWMERYIDKSYLKIKRQKTQPKIMNIQQLSGGFQILVIGLTISIFMFTLELLAKSLKLQSSIKFLTFFKRK